MKQSERRSHRRIPLNLSLCFAIEPNDGERWQQADAINISTGGVLLTCVRSNASVGDTIAVEISLTPGQSGQAHPIEIRSRAEVLRVRRRPRVRDSTRSHELAVRFIAPIDLLF